MRQNKQRSFDPTTLEIYRALYTSVAEEMGIAVAGIGDINGDGLADFAAGAPGGADSSTLGSVQVFLGRATPSASPGGNANTRAI